MNQTPADIAAACLAGAESNTISFPDIIAALMKAGFDGYMVDYRRGHASYYGPGGISIDLAMHPVSVPMAAAFDAAAIQAAIRAAQQQLPGYSYAGFCEQAVRSGCAGYVVSLPGRRVLYFGRDGEIHVEHFPQQPAP
jgi:uncharacterized protein YbcV (DUF1398 family)